MNVLGTVGGLLSPTPSVPSAGPTMGTGYEWLGTSGSMMQHGGMITEPIYGIGKSGKRYSFGETEPELVTPQSKLGEKSGQERTSINIINVIDPKQMDQWAASAAGNKAIINAIGSNIGIVSRMLK